MPNQSRRGFLGSLGLGAAALMFNGLPWPEPTPIVNGVVGTPAVSLAETFKVGDVFTIAGRYALDPVTRQPTTKLLRFTVTAVVGPNGAPCLRLG